MRRVSSRISTFAAPVMLGWLFIAGCSMEARDSWYRFGVANGRLYAIETGSSYGTETAVFTTDDDGKSWRQATFPARTYGICGNGTVDFALTSDNKVWRRAAEGQPWTLVASLRGSHNYCILADRKGRFLVGGVNEVAWYDNNGKLISQFIPPPSKRKTLFASARFVDGDDEHVLLEGNPGCVFMLDLKQGKLSQWSEGLPAVEENVSGLARVRSLGNGFLMGRGDGIYISPGVREPWQLLTTQFQLSDSLDTELCRDLIGYKPESNSWLVAANAGIHLMEDGKIGQTVFTDTTTNHANNDDHDLIMQIVPFHDYYFVSFSRLRNNAMGVRLSRDLKHWNTIRNVEKN